MVLQLPGLKDVLIATYVALTTLKVVQWAIFTYGKSNKKKSGMYTASLSVLMNAISYMVLGVGDTNHIGKVPRKAFKEITSPWTADYNRRYPTNDAANFPKKTYSSLDHALKEFFMEFTQETTSLYVDNAKHFGMAYLRHPLGSVLLSRYFFAQPWLLSFLLENCYCIPEKTFPTLYCARWLLQQRSMRYL